MGSEIFVFRNFQSMFGGGQKMFGVRQPVEWLVYLWYIST